MCAQAAFGIYELWIYSEIFVVKISARKPQPFYIEWVSVIYLRFLFWNFVNQIRIISK